MELAVFLMRDADWLPLQFFPGAFYQLAQIMMIRFLKKIHSPREIRIFKVPPKIHKILKICLILLDGIA